MLDWTHTGYLVGPNESIFNDSLWVAPIENGLPGGALREWVGECVGVAERKRALQIGSSGVS